MNHPALFKTLSGAGLVLPASISTALAANATFPGGAPITASDLTATPPVLPSPPPAYQATADHKGSPTHEEFARFAWRQFIYMNSPSKQQSGTVTTGKTPVVRGVVSPSGNFKQSGSKTFYQDGKTGSTDNFSKNILVWESFAHRSELFPRNATPTGDFQNLDPEYKFTNENGTTPLTVPSSQARFNNLDENSQIGQNKIFFPKNGNTPSTNPYDDHEILFEAKVNQVEYDYIKSLNGKAPGTFELDNESIEIKAAWRSLSTSQIQSGRYHTAEALYYTEQNGVTSANVGTFGLVGLHIIRKMPNYEALVFSTFEHVDNLTTPSGADSGLYFITTYDTLCYGAPSGTTSPQTCTEEAASDPSAIINNGVNHILVALPKHGDVVASNGYPFIPGNYTLPAGTHGPIKVVQPPTITKAVSDVNREVKTAMANTSGFSDSVWQYYELKGVQPLPVNEDTSITGANNPLTEDYFLANNVVESSRSGVQLFKGGAPGPQPLIVSGVTKNTLPNPRTGTASLNIQNVPGLDASYNQVTMGGCMGCHGQAKYTQSNGKVASIFSFLISTSNLNGTGGFEADPVDEAEPASPAKTGARYMAK